MTNTKAMSKSEMILLAAYERWPESEFTSEELVVACWRKYPDSFGLQGYSHQYPDSNIVYRYIMGKSSIVKKQRWLSQKSQKRYVLTPPGISYALKIRGIDGPKEEVQRHRIDRFYEQVMLRVLAGSAWNKFNNRLERDLTFTDACGFWSINPRSSGEQYRAARRDLAEAISTMKRELTGGKSEVSLGSKVGVSIADVKNVEALEQELDTKFKDQLDLISRRSVRWGKLA